MNETTSIRHGGSAAAQDVGRRRFQMASIRVPPDARRAILSGVWTLKGFRRDLSSLRSQLRRLARQPDQHWDLRPIESLDSIGALVLWRAWGERLPTHLRARSGHLALLRQWSTHQPLPPPPRKPALQRLTVEVGDRFLATLAHLRAALILLIWNDLSSRRNEKSVVFIC